MVISDIAGRAASQPFHPRASTPKKAKDTDAITPSSREAELEGERDSIQAALSSVLVQLEKEKRRSKSHEERIAELEAEIARPRGGATDASARGLIHGVSLLFNAMAELEPHLPAELVAKLKTRAGAAAARTTEKPIEKPIEKPVDSDGKDADYQPSPRRAAIKSTDTTPKRPRRGAVSHHSAEEVSEPAEAEADSGTVGAATTPRTNPRNSRKRQSAIGISNEAIADEKEGHPIGKTRQKRPRAASLGASDGKIASFDADDVELAKAERIRGPGGTFVKKTSLMPSASTATSGEENQVHHESLQKGRTGAAEESAQVSDGAQGAKADVDAAWERAVMEQAALGGWTVNKRAKVPEKGDMGPPRPVKRARVSSSKARGV